MERFHKIDDAAAITLSRGVYRQSAVYRRGDNLYVAHGSGFLRLSSGGGTSMPSVSWKDLDLGDGSYREDTFSVVYVAPVVRAAE